jgi:hypothetical protein
VREDPGDMVVAMLSSDSRHARAVAVILVAGAILLGAGVEIATRSIASQRRRADGTMRREKDEQVRPGFVQIWRTRAYRVRCVKDGGQVISSQCAFRCESTLFMFVAKEDRVILLDKEGGGAVTCGTSAAEVPDKVPTECRHWLSRLRTDTAPRHFASDCESTPR